MQVLIRKRLLCTTIYSITGKGLRISKQSLFGYSSITIPHDKLDETTCFGKKYNKDLLNTSFVILILGIFRLIFTKTITDFWFLLMFVVFAVCLGLVIYLPKKTVKEPKRKIFAHFPQIMDNKVETFLDNLFETRDYFMRYREIDLRDGTDFEKKYAELVSLFTTGLINKQEFLQRRWLLKLNPLCDYSRFGPFFN